MYHYQTSTGVGHPYPQQCPEKNLQWRYLKPLPLGMCSGVTCRPMTIGDMYNTTSHHDYRVRTRTTPSESMQPRAAGNWKVHYTTHAINKCRDREWCPPLTMGNQKSEMKRNFQAKPDPLLSRLPDSTHDQPLLQNYQDHVNNQHTIDTKLVASSKPAQGHPIVPSDNAVLDNLETYLTTNNSFHHFFTDKECTHYPRNDVATYWQCEDYPKAWGYGLNSNPLDLEEGEKMDKSGPMHDRMVFSTPTKLPQLPLHTAKPVSNGLQSLHSDMFSIPSASKTRRLFYQPVPPTTSVNKDTTQMNSVPHMYKSTNTTYGN